MSSLGATDSSIDRSTDPPIVTTLSTKSWTVIRLMPTAVEMRPIARPSGKQCSPRKHGGLGNGFDAALDQAAGSLRRPASELTEAVRARPWRRCRRLDPMGARLPTLPVSRGLGDRIRITDATGTSTSTSSATTPQVSSGRPGGPVEAAVVATLDSGWSYGGVHTDEVRLRRRSSIASHSTRCASPTPGPKRRWRSSWAAITTAVTRWWCATSRITAGCCTSATVASRCGRRSSCPPAVQRSRRIHE